MKYLKKTPSIVFLSLFLLITMSSGCKNESGENDQKDYRIPTSATIMEQYNMARPDWDKSEKTEGPVDIVVEDNVISITHDAYNSDAIVTYYFQSDKKVKKLKSGHIDIAEVMFLERNLIVNSVTNKNTLFFSVDADHTPEYLSDLKGVKTYIGYGLGARKIFKGKQSVDAFYCKCVPAGYPEGGCPTSNSLSIDCNSSNEHGSCRVFCTGQYFACCGTRGE